MNRFSQFRCLHIAKGETVPNLNKDHEFQICFVLKGILYFFRNQSDSMSQVVMENELFFINSIHTCKLRAMEDVLLVVHACNILPPFLHDKVIKYLQDIEIEKVEIVDILPVYPLMRSYLDLLINYMKTGIEIPDLHQVKEIELFSLFKICFTKNEIASIFREVLSTDLRFFVAVMTNYKRCRTAKELASLCGYRNPMFSLLFKRCFRGETPYQWLQKQTSHEIRLKLEEDSLSIKQIMLEYHFKTFSHFTTYCKRNIGATPNEIRRQGKVSEVQLVPLV